MQNANDLLKQAQQAEEAGDKATALARYTQVLKHHPREIALHIRCGNLCAELGRFEEAAGYFRRVLHATKSDDARNALCFCLESLGNQAHTQGKFALAAAGFEEALLHQPNNAIFWYNLGNAQRELNQTQLALASFKRAIALNPNDADFYNNLGNIERELGALDLAIAAYEKALQLNPQLHHALVHLVHQKQHMCDWQGLHAQIEQIRHCVNHEPNAQISPFAFLSMPTTSAAEQRTCASSYINQTYAHLAALRAQLKFTYTKNKNIRLGYLSADFRLHPLAFLITEMIQSHDKTQFETYAYSYGIDDKTSARKALEASFDHFIDIRNVNDIDAAKKINADQIDILIDLTGFTQSSRTGIVALKPAPIHINWLGYPGTMGDLAGEPLFDWILADKVTVENPSDFSEKVLYLPCYQPNHPRKMGAKTQKSSHHLGESFVYCCFNQTFKITPEIFAIWMQLLHDVPNSVLWLLECNPWAKANLQSEAEKAGIAKRRLIFAPRVSIDAHIERQRHADLFLDTLPYNAHTTASDALYMGLPVITCTGETFSSRVAASLLMQLGLTELICTNLQDYAEKAHYLAQNPQALTHIKQQLTQQIQTSNLFNPAHFAKMLETELIALYQVYLARQ